MITEFAMMSLEDVPENTPFFAVNPANNKLALPFYGRASFKSDIMVWVDVPVKMDFICNKLSDYSNRLNADHSSYEEREDLRKQVYLFSRNIPWFCSETIYSDDEVDLLHDTILSGEPCPIDCNVVYSAYNTIMQHYDTFVFYPDKNKFQYIPTTTILPLGKYQPVAN